MLSALTLTFACSVLGDLFTSDEVGQRNLFENFKLNFNRTYENKAEETIRFQNFLEFLKVVDQRQRLADSNKHEVTHGITNFADWSQVI